MNRLAQVLVQKVADAFCSSLLDQMIRASILEGVAGEEPTTWTRTTAALALARRALPDLDPKWFDRDTGMCAAAWAAGNQIIRRREEVEDLLQAILGGLTLTSAGGELYAIGKALSMDGNISLPRAKGMLLDHVKKRSKSQVSRSRREVSLLQEDDDGHSVEKDVPTAPEMETVVDEVLEYLSDPGGFGLYKRIRDDLAATMFRNSPSRVVILDEIIHNPKRSDVQIARDMGHGEKDPEPWIQLGAATRISLTRRDLRKHIPEFLKNNPDLLQGLVRDLHLKQELANLGFGTSRRFASLGTTLSYLLRFAPK